jgi:hypothetical protein
MNSATEKISDIGMPDLLTKLLADRRLALLFDDRLLDQITTPFYHKLAESIGRIMTANRLEVSEAADRYLKFATQYTADLARFEVTGQYQPRIEHDPAEYQTMLLLSCLLTWQRFKIFELVYKHHQLSTRTAVIGCGPGIEVEMLLQFGGIVDVFEVNPPESIVNLADQGCIRLCQNLFTVDQIRYDSIYLIEVLEHVKDPFSLLSTSVAALDKSGSIFCTSAINIPQFDHLYNFACGEIEKWAGIQGLKIRYVESIQHLYLNRRFSSLNEFLVISAT